MSACRIHVTRAPRHQHSIISRIYQTPIRGYVICRAAPSDEPGALREALELFNQSRELATLQTRAELINAFVADGEAEVARIDGNPAALRRAIAGYLVELGLTQTASEKLAKDLQEAGKVASLEQLAARVSRLQRVLPEADIGAMVAKDSAILDVDSRLAIRNMVVLVEAFPGKDLVSILSRQPRLLYCADLPERRDRVFAHLVKLHPSKDPRVIGAVVAEHPELLYRMDYYKHARMIDELPIELQNMFVVADQGIGFLHRYYKRRANNFVADTSDEEAGF